MRYLWAFLKSLLVVITLSAQSLYAVETYNQRSLIEEIYGNMPFYIEYLAQTPSFNSILESEEQERLNLLVQYFRSIQRLPDLDFSRPREDFLLEPNQEERIAKTQISAYANIDFNMGLITVRSLRLEIPFIVQLLIHEFGHKLANAKEQQAILDKLATKAGLYFKAYTKVLKISRQWSILSLSLPINWFYWPLIENPAHYRSNYRKRPNTLVALRNEQSGFQSLTEYIYESLAHSPVLWAAGETQNVAFTDTQMHLEGWEFSSQGIITVSVRSQKKLQNRSGPRNAYLYEAYRTVVEDQQRLRARFYDDNKEINFQSIPKGRENFETSVRTTLEKKSDTSYRLTMLDYKSDEPAYLRLSTAQGLIILPAEKGTNSFSFTIPKMSSAQFVEIQTIQSASEGIQFLDRAYWFAIEPSSARETRAQFMQVEVKKEWGHEESTKWQLINQGKLLVNKWGRRNFRIQLEKYRKIRQIRFVWSIERRHFETHNLKRPHIYNLFEQRDVVATGYFGSEFATEFDIFEETFSEDKIQQHMRTLTVLADLGAKDIKEYSSAQYTSSMGSFFGNFVQTVRTHLIKGQDMGNWQLHDVIVTDENLESTSLMSGELPILFKLTGSGLTECEEWVLKQKNYNHSLLPKGVRRKPGFTGGR